MTKFPAGFSWITCSVSLSGFPDAKEAILRIGPPYGLFAPYSAMPEFESLTALAASQVPGNRTPGANFAKFAGLSAAGMAGPVQSAEERQSFSPSGGPQIH